MSTVLLIDADVFVYKAGQRVERPTQWDESLWTLHAELDDGIRELNTAVGRLQEELDATHTVMALTDYSEPNWRDSVDPEYKQERRDSNKRRPILWKGLRDYIHEESGDAWETYQRPSLEGDDVLGVLLTGRKWKDKRKVCVSIDKDMKTLPGLHLNYDHALQSDDDWEEHVVEITKEAADRFHLAQALAGDPTDGYGGCPGIGMVRAVRYLEAGKVFEPYEHEFKRGERKGDTEIRWEPGEDGTDWEVVVSLYESKGLTEDDALRNARLARILRASDYVISRKEVKLWCPKE